MTPSSPRPWIRRAVLREIAQALAAAYPDEGCGLVTMAGSEPRVRVARNLARDGDGVAEPGSSRARVAYRLDERLLAVAEQRNEQVAAIFHSHPDGTAQFSATDLADAVMFWAEEAMPAFPGVDYLVVAVTADGVHEARVFRVRDDGSGADEIANLGRPAAQGEGPWPW